jgi:hypothetical protein
MMLMQKKRMESQTDIVMSDSEEGEADLDGALSEEEGEQELEATEEGEMEVDEEGEDEEFVSESE